MNYDLVGLKKELGDLLQLIHQGTATLEDASKLLNAPLEKQRARMIAEIELQKQELDQKRDELWRLASEEYRRSGDAEAIRRLNDEKARGFVWLANAYEEYFKLKDLQLADFLQSKTHPALKAAEQVRQIAKERREAEQAARIAESLLSYCRFLAPWLDEYIGMEADELDDIIANIHSSWEKKQADFDEEVKRHFGPRYEELTPAERLQRKLDWYWEKPNKTNWQIGRDYERCVGYLYEVDGWDVHYHGKKGFEDLGRDLVCKKGGNAEIIQCKYWSREKAIHEKHIYYLFGTTVEYCVEQYECEESEMQLALFPEFIRSRNVIPKLVTTTEPSAKAREVADILGVMIENVPFQRYPSIKCNVSRRTGEKIYHLPFDQQYDNVLIEEERLERYAETVAEAEALGFRHAYRWKGYLTEPS